MPFNENERAAIRHYLGFPDIFQDHNPRLESALDVVGDRTEPAQRARDILTNLGTIDAKILEVLDAAGIKKVDEVEFFGRSKNSALDDVRRQGRQWVGRLSILFGVDIQSDVFGEDGYRGDNWARRGNQYGGNIIGLG